MGQGVKRDTVHRPWGPMACAIRQNPWLPALAPYALFLGGPLDSWPLGTCLLMTNGIVDLDVLLSRNIPGIIAGHPLTLELLEALAVGVPKV